jgi:hypothetical protein
MNGRPAFCETTMDIEPWSSQCGGCPVSVRLSANDYRSLNQHPLWLCSEIELVGGAVKANSAEACPIEAQRDRASTQKLIIGAGVALNASHIKQRHIRHKTVNRHTIPSRLTNTAARKWGDGDGERLASANGVWDDYCRSISVRNQPRRHGV